MQQTATPAREPRNSVARVRSNGMDCHIQCVFCFNNNNNNCTTSNETLLLYDDDDIAEENQFIQPFWRQVLWTCLFAGMVIVSTAGNLVVIWIVMANRRMRTVTNYFLVNLSVADTMVSTLNVIFNFIYMLNADWPFGDAYCKVSNFVAVLSISASVFTLVAISVDRYMAITTPLKPRMSRVMTINIAVTIWLLSGILSIPNLIFSTTKTEYFSRGDSRTVCYTEWPDGPMTQSDDEYIYNVILMTLTYFLPIIAMSYAYARVGIQLWGSRSIGENTAKQMENVRSKRRIVKMMIVVVVIFAVCWLPFHIYFIVTYHHREVTKASYIQQVYLAIYWLAMSNSMYNPIIYCWMNSKFRQGFKRVFCCIPGICTSTNNIDDQRARSTTLRYSSSFSPYQQNRLGPNGTVTVPLQTLFDDNPNENG